MILPGEPEKSQQRRPWKREAFRIDIITTEVEEPLPH
jgi:hypothetical protein